MSFLKVARFLALPVEGCQVRATSRMNIRLHFMHHHVRYTMVILDKVKIPHTICTYYKMSVLLEALNGRHPSTALCTKGVELKWCRLSAEEYRSGVERTFPAYGQTFTNMASLKYLGRPLKSTDD